MRAWRKQLSVIICFCISLYALPAFAFVAINEVDAVKIELSDHELGLAIGAGQLDFDATVADVKVGDTVVNAVVVNRSTTDDVRYAIHVITVSDQGDVIDIKRLVFGLLKVDEVKTLTVQTATPLGVSDTDQQKTLVRVRVWKKGTQGFEAIDIASPS